MAVKSVIDIDVKDEAFKNFQAQFEKYKAAVDEMPERWRAVGDEVSKTGSVFEQMLAAMLAQKAITEGISEAEEEAAAAAEKKRREQDAAARRGILHWREIARSTREVAGNLLSATGTLLKWTGITGAIGGYFTLRGIGNMADSVTATSRSSRGLGLGYGEQRSFGVNFGNVIDPGSFLGAVNESLRSWDARRGLIGAGLTANEMQGSTGQVGSALLVRLKAIADKTNPAGLAEMMKARGIDRYVTIEDMMRLRSMNASEFGELQSRYATDAKNLDVRRSTQEEWRKFTQQMERAGDQIEKTFAEGLVRLAPGFKKLSEGFVSLIESVSKSDTVKKWMDDLSSGLSRFAGYVGTPEFATKVERFVDAVGKVANGIAWLAVKFGNLFGDTPPTPELPAFHKRPMFLSPLAPSVSQKFTDLENKRNLPPGLLSAVYAAESSSGADTGPSSKGALGPFQFLESTAKEYGIDDRMNLDQSANGASRYLQDLKNKYDGDVAKAVAAYNYGPGNLDRTIAKHGDDWARHTPRETQDYMVKVLSRLLQGSQTKVEISNNTGANVITQTSQIAR